MAHDCVGDQELNNLSSSQDLGIAGWDSEVHSSSTVVTVHEGVDEVIHIHNPDHIDIVFVEVDKSKVASQGVMVPVHEHQWLLACHNEESVDELRDFGDYPQEGPIAGNFVGLQVSHFGVGGLNSLLEDDFQKSGGHEHKSQNAEHRQNGIPNNQWSGQIKRFLVGHDVLDGPNGDNISNHTFQQKGLMVH